ncbi:MAG: T9SS type A sorting domain-containing protein [Bacteroidetes bacterium]|nr:T9SS type A sorting domain-containing protein [Bacteroidota bacterium]
MKQKITLFLLFTFAFFCPDLFAQAPPVVDWQKCLGGSGTDIANKVIHSNDGGYILAGSTTSSNGDITANHGSRDIWIVKMNNQGVVQWQKTLGGSASDFAASVFQLPGNDIIVGGYTSSNNGNVTGNHGSMDEWLVRLDESGNILWQKTFGGSSVDICNAVIPVSDGGFLLAGSTSSNNGNVSGNHGNKDFWIVKTDSLGNLQWQQAYGGSAADECFSIREIPGGSFIASGYTGSNDGQVTGNHGGLDYWMIRINSSGNLLWQKCFGGSSNEVATSSLFTADGNILIGGYSNSNDGDVYDHHGSSDFWLVEVDSSGGSLIAARSYGGSYSDIAYDLIPTADGGYLLSGGSTSNDYDVNGNSGGEDFWLTKTDAYGNIAWARTYGGPGNDRPASVVQNDDGGFSVAGYTYSNNSLVSGNHGGADIWFLTLSCLTPVSDFTIPSDTVCINAIVNFTNASVHAAQYEWQKDGILFSYNTNPNFQFYSTGTFKISLISHTCYVTDTLDKFITVVSYPVASISTATAYLCDGDTAVLSSVTADHYTWSTGDTTSSIPVYSGGTYSLAITSHGCSASASYSINQYHLPEINLGNDTAICSGNSIVLHAQPGYSSYLWQDGSSDSLFTVNADGTYSVTVSNGYCHSESSVSVSMISNPSPVITAGASHLCDGDSTTLSTGTAGTYLWNTGDTTSSISIFAGGNYAVTVSENGCKGTASFNISQYANPLISLGNDTTICSSDSIILHVPGGYQSYVWQDGSSDSLFPVHAAGSYSVTVSNGYCHSESSVSVSMISNPSPVINTGTSYLCDGSSTTLSTGTADTYLWNTGDTISSISIFAGGNYSVMVSENGCKGSASFSISQYSNPAINLGNDTTICSADSIMLQVPAGYQSYVWQDGSSDSVFLVSSGGIYSVTVSDGFCSSTDSIVIATRTCIVLSANFIASQNSICQNSCISFTDLSQNAVVWHWYFPGASTSFSDQQNPVNICYPAPGDYAVYLIVYASDSSVTGMMQTNFITVHPAPSVPQITITNGTFLTSTQASSYQWLLSSAPVQGETFQTYNVVQEGSYAVMITDEYGCTAVSDSVFIGFTGIQDPGSLSEPGIFPNPSSGLFTIRTGSGQPAEIDIRDLTGKIIYQTTALVEWKADLSHFSSGVYFITIKTVSGSFHNRLLIRR